MAFLDDLEEWISTIYNFTLSHRKALRAALGSALLFNGNELLGTILLLQGIKVCLML
jgi:hypothetical protein